MNHFLRLRQYRFFIRKVYGSLHMSDYNNCECYSKPCKGQNVDLPRMNSAVFTYSYNQIREFAKKAHGKAKGVKKKMQLSDDEMSLVIDIDDYRQQLTDVADKLKKDYVEQLSIRSAVGNIENIVVKINDEEFPLNELAVISKKNPNLIAINMSDFPEGLKPAVQAIVESGSGFNPQQDGTMIYVSIPKMTREHRENLAKSAKTLFTKSKEHIKSIQNSFIKDAKDKTELSEDLVFSATNQIMAIAEQSVQELEKLMKSKQKELLGDS